MTVNLDITRGYEYLAELLIADLRLDEALQIVKHLDKIKHTSSVNRILAKMRCVKVVMMPRNYCCMK